MCFYRANVEQFNHQCFERSAKICEPIDIVAKKPRICRRQIIRDNVEAESPEDYFRKSITVPFLYCTLRDRPFNLQRGLWGFFFRLEKFVRTTRELEKKIQEFNIRLYDKNSESDYYLFSSTKIRILPMSSDLSCSDLVEDLCKLE
jgi:hypothetical protein